MFIQFLKTKFIGCQDYWIYQICQDRKIILSSLSRLYKLSRLYNNLVKIVMIIQFLVLLKIFRILHKSDLAQKFEIVTNVTFFWMFLEQLFQSNTLLGVVIWCGSRYYSIMLVRTPTDRGWSCVQWWGQNLLTSQIWKRANFDYTL